MTALHDLVTAARSDDPRDWAGGAAWLAGIDGPTWLSLDDAARRFSRATAYSVPVSGIRGWLGPALDEPSGFVAAVTSLHVDGRFRQRATGVLARSGGLLAASALAVRALDHVPQVRTDARAALASRTGLDDAAAVLAVLLAGRRRIHGPGALASFLDALDAAVGPALIFGRLRRSPEPAVRRWAHARAHDAGLLDPDALAVLVTRERDQFLRAEAARWLAPVATGTQLRALLHARFVDGRLLALTRLRDEDLDLGQLLELLDDASARVRETAQWRARRREVDPAAVYRGRLVAGGRRPSRRAASIDGLVATGDQHDAELVGAHLMDANARVRAAAVAGVVALGGAAPARERLRPLLLDRSPRVSAAAARGLARLPAGVDTDEAWASAQPWSRRAAWRLDRHGGGWDRVVADLRAAADDEPRLSGLGRAGLRDWLETSAATTWGRPSAAQLDRMPSLLPRAGLGATMERLLAFHAGMDLPRFS